MRWLVVLLMLLPLPAQAQQGIEADDIRLELILEDRPHPPHVGEMILLMIRGTFKVAVVREALEQSPLTGFDWMQLGEDRWYKAREDGFEVLKFERRMALYPQRSGRIEIPPFVHQLEVLNPRRETVKTTEESNALTVEATPEPSGVDWWFPVRNIEISDRWSNQPEALATGAAALRIVALTVEGTAPQRIPPMPEMTGAGAFVFPHPEQKIVSLGPDGPVTRVFWRWTVRPDQDSAGYMNPIPITYFDAETREMRTISLSAQRVVYAEGPQHVLSSQLETEDGVASLSVADRYALPNWSTAASLIAGLAFGLVWLFWRWGGAGFTLPTWLRPNATRAGLRRAVRSDDAHAVWRYCRRLLGDQPYPKKFQELDAAVFAGRPPPVLKEVAREVRAASRR